MIIKIKSHKKPAYGKILNYLLNDRDRLFDIHGNSFLLTQNLKGTDIRSWISELQEIHSKRKNTRKGQIFYTHEILSFHRDSAPHLTVDKMHDITKEYVRLRGGNRAVVIGTPHQDTKHRHIHLVVASTDRAGNSMRITKAELASVKKQVQQWYLTRYPELGKSAVRHGKLTPHEKLAVRADKTTRRKDTKVASVHERVQSCYADSETYKEFIERLYAANLSPYMRGSKITGVEIEGQKYRFKRLGIDVSVLPIKEKSRTITRKSRTRVDRFER